MRQTPSSKLRILPLPQPLLLLPAYLYPAPPPPYPLRSLGEIDPHEPNVVQRYLHRPHLLEGYKYDLRLYVLLTSLAPLRAFLFKEGLVRLCTLKFSSDPSSLGAARMHLTNYAINKGSEDYVQPGSEADGGRGAQKRLVSSLMQTLEADGRDTRELWDEIGQLCIKTLISVQPHLQHTYERCRGIGEDAGSGCFELLGFDVLLDHRLRPYLLEVNHSPSFTCDSPLDEQVKGTVLSATLALVSHTREELRLLKTQRHRLEPGVRERLQMIREAYECERAPAVGFVNIFPNNGFAGANADANAALAEQYRRYLKVARDLYREHSIAGSRRESFTCGAKGRVPSSREPPAACACGSPAAVAAMGRQPASARAGAPAPRAAVSGGCDRSGAGMPVFQSAAGARMARRGSVPARGLIGGDGYALARGGSSRGRARAVVSARALAVGGNGGAAVASSSAAVAPIRECAAIVPRTVSLPLPGGALQLRQPPQAPIRQLPPPASRGDETPRTPRRWGSSLPGGALQLRQPPQAPIRQLPPPASRGDETPRTPGRWGSSRWGSACMDVAAAGPAPCRAVATERARPGCRATRDFWRCSLPPPTASESISSLRKALRAQAGSVASRCEERTRHRGGVGGVNDAASEIQAPRWLSLMRL